MQRRTILHAGATLLLAASLPVRADDGVVVIAHAPSPGADAALVKRIWMGRTADLEGLTLRPVNMPPGQPLRQRFLRAFLQQEDDDYVAYWTVRRYIGNGAPPGELASTAAVVAFVARTPGAWGYIDASALTADMHAVMTR